MMGTAVDEFWRRLLDVWLPAYCNNPTRMYSQEGFKSDRSILSETDATNFPRAVDQKVVSMDSGGRFKMPRSNATEVLFWEHEKSITPRPITLWLEPVITIAAAAKLHLEHGWPLDCIGMQSVDYAFDLIAFLPGRPDHEYIAGEVKPTAGQLTSMVTKMRGCCSEGNHTHCLESSARRNAHRKWLGLARCRAPLFWAIGPAGNQEVFQVIYSDERPIELTETFESALGFPSPEELMRQISTLV